MRPFTALNTERTNLKHRAAKEIENVLFAVSSTIQGVLQIEATSEEH